MTKAKTRKPRYFKNLLNKEKSFLKKPMIAKIINKGKIIAIQTAHTTTKILIMKENIIIFYFHQYILNIIILQYLWGNTQNDRSRVIHTLLFSGGFSCIL